MNETELMLIGSRQKLNTSSGVPEVWAVLSTSSVAAELWLISKMRGKLV